MRLSSRILQVIVILLGAFFFFLAITFKTYLVSAVIVALTTFGWAALGFSGIDPTLKNPTARRYFRIVFVLGIFIVIAIVANLIMSLFYGDIKAALKMLGSLILIASPLWRFRNEIPSWLQK